MAFKEVELYALPTRKAGEFLAYEKHPVPGGNDMAVSSGPTAEAALENARAYLRTRPGGSCFKAERSVVGA